MKVSPALTNFNSGEFSPLLDGRVDFDRYGNGATLMENMIPTVQGPAVRRGGTRYVAGVKTAANRVWLQPFEFNQDEAYVLEFGDQYVRFFTQGGQLVSGMTPVEVATPYTQADLFASDGTCRLRFAQSGDFLYIAHPLYEPRVLKRTSPTTFQLDLLNAVGGPFKTLETGGATIIASDQTGTVTLTANADLFLPGHVGSLLLLENNDLSSIPAWEPAKAITAGNRRRSDGKTYEALTSATTGINRPVHTEGSRLDGDPGVRWEYRDPGFGYVKITGVTNSRTATATVVDRLPVDNIRATLSLTISGIVLQSFSGSPTFRVTTSAPHGGSTGNTVVIRGVSDTYTQAFGGTRTNVTNGSWTITVVSATQFDITVSSILIPSTGYTYNSGGTAEVFATITSLGTQRWAFGAWSDVEGWPSSVTFFRERLCFARDQSVWMSVAAAFDDFSARDKSGQVTADLAISLDVSSGEINEIEWLHPERELLAGTAGGEFSIGELTNGDPLGPGNVRAQLQSRFGSRAVQPIGSGGATLFVLRAGLRLREIAYEFASDGYQTRDVTTLSEHITRPGVVDMDFALEPYSVVWCVRSDGTLLGFTWNNEDQVKGWHRHLIGGDGIVETVATIPNPNRTGDQVWMVVRRTVNGSTVRYVEYMADPWKRGDRQVDQFYVDSGLTYDGAPATTIAGLGHLEGATVDVLVDGAPHPQRVVTGGQITLQRAGSVVQVGLPFRSRLWTMRIEAGARDGTAQAKTKRMHKVAFRFLDTAGCKVGPSADRVDLVEFRTPADPMDAPPPLYTGDKLVSWPGGYETDGRIYVEHDQPTACTLVAIYPQVETQDAR